MNTKISRSQDELLSVMIVLSFRDRSITYRLQQYTYITFLLTHTTGGLSKFDIFFIIVGQFRFTLQTSPFKFQYFSVKFKINVAIQLNVGQITEVIKLIDGSSLKFRRNKKHGVQMLQILREEFKKISTCTLWY